VLIVVLLGHGMGMIISFCVLSDAIGVAVILCLLWGLLVLGGAGWGLWVAHVQDQEAASQRFALILIGILSPFALVGVLFGVTFFSFLLLALSVQSAEAYLSIGGALLIIAVSAYVLARAHHHHSEAKRVLEICRAEQFRTDAKEQSA